MVIVPSMCLCVCVKLLVSKSSGYRGGTLDKAFLTHCRLNELPHTILSEESNLDFRLCDLDIPRDKWLNCLQTVETLIRRCILRCLISVCSVCQLPF